MVNPDDVEPTDLQKIGANLEVPPVLVPAAVSFVVSTEAAGEEVVELLQSSNSVTSSSFSLSVDPFDAEEAGRLEEVAPAVADASLLAPICL